MSSSTQSMRRCEATRRPSRRLSGSESCSGISTLSTLRGPAARTQSAATTLLSTPPERPTTTPRLRRSFSTWPRSVAEICSTAAAGSMRRASVLNCGLIAAPSLQLHHHLAPADLAVGRFRQAVAELDRLRHHEILQPLRAVADHLAPRETGGRVGLHDCPDSHAERRVGYRRARGFTRPRVAAKNIL